MEENHEEWITVSSRRQKTPKDRNKDGSDHGDMVQSNSRSNPLIRPYSTFKQVDESPKQFTLDEYKSLQKAKNKQNNGISSQQNHWIISESNSNDVSKTEENSKEQTPKTNQKQKASIPLVFKSFSYDILSSNGHIQTRQRGTNGYYDGQRFE